MFLDKSVLVLIFFVENISATTKATTTTEAATTSSFGSSWSPYKCGDCGCCCRPEHAPYCNYDITPYLPKGTIVKRL